MQDALERAYSKDVEGWRLDAIKLYRIGVDAIREGLALRVPSAGLGPAFSNVARWREDLKQWLQRANDRRGAAPLPVTFAQMWRKKNSLVQACASLAGAAWSSALRVQDHDRISRTRKARRYTCA